MQIWVPSLPKPPLPKARCSGASRVATWVAKGQIWASEWTPKGGFSGAPRPHRSYRLIQKKGLRASGEHILLGRAFEWVAFRLGVKDIRRSTPDHLGVAPSLEDANACFFLLFFALFDYDEICDFGGFCIFSPAIFGFLLEKFPSVKNSLFWPRFSPGSTISIFVLFAFSLSTKKLIFLQNESFPWQSQRYF